MRLGMIPRLHFVLPRDLCYILYVTSNEDTTLGRRDAHIVPTHYRPCDYNLYPLAGCPSIHSVGTAHGASCC